MTRKRKKSGRRKKQRKKGKDPEKENSILLGFTVAFSIVLAVGVFMILPYFISLLFQKLTDSQLLISIAEGVVRILIFVGYILLISRMKDIQRTFMYHGAEHKCINCIEHGMELNVENVRKSSREHKALRNQFPSDCYDREYHFLSIYTGTFPDSPGGGSSASHSGDRGRFL